MTFDFLETMAAKEALYYRFRPSESGTYDFSVNAENTICWPFTLFPDGYGWEESPIYCTAGDTYYVYVKNKNKFEITDVTLSIKRQGADNIDVVSPEKVTNTTSQAHKYVTTNGLVIVGDNGHKYTAAGQCTK